MEELITREDHESIDVPSQVKDSDPFDNYRTNLVTTVAYLLGVPEDEFKNGGIFDIDTYSAIKADVNAEIIRSLCILRQQIFINYTEINMRRNNLTPLDSMTDIVSADLIRFLRKHDIDITSIATNSPNVTYNVAYINQFILDRIDKIKKHIPEWIKYEYVRSLFLIPGGYAGPNGSQIRNKNQQQSILTKIHVARGEYLQHKAFCPYRVFLMWPRMLDEDDGNVLYNDAKFLKMLYGANKDFFAATEYIIDAEQTEKDSIYEFVNEAYNIAVFVDCENVNPFAFAATILNLDAKNLKKIKKIVLYDDVNTSTAWDHIDKLIDLEFEKNDLNRVLDNKSLVDVTMTAGVCTAFYKDAVESIILVSSDSDFWGLMSALPNARFFVLNESVKTSKAILDKFDEKSIKHCFMDKFAQDKVQEFKDKLLGKGLSDFIKHFNETGEFKSLYVEDLIRSLFYDVNVIGSDSQVTTEKELFYAKYLKRGFIITPVEQDGKLVFKMALNN